MLPWHHDPSLHVAVLSFHQLGITHKHRRIHSMARATIKIDLPNKKVTIEMPLEVAPSKSGTMVLLTSTRGNQETDTQYEGKAVFANVNLGVYAKAKE